MPILAGTRLGRYEIRSPLGAGGMGEVYLAQDTELERAVALKVLHSEVAGDQRRMRRFIQEAKAASALNHPNIIVIHEIGQVDSTYFIATEFIDGMTLRQYVLSTRMKLSEVLDVAIQVTHALTAAHAAGIVHRDIKPENIMVRSDGYVKLLDFGLIKLMESHGSDLDAVTMLTTEPGMVVGTVYYMSPEQARGLKVDARTDIWSLGCVLYEMLAGRPPFGGATANEIIASILEKEPPPLARYSREVPSDLERIVMKALVKDREERYQTIKDLSLDLKSLKQELEFKAKLDRLIQSGLAPRTSPTLLQNRDRCPNNLPVQPTPLIGRKAEVAAVSRLLRRRDVRLLTLTGPGGTGKTRLSLEVAAGLLEEFQDGVYFVALASICDAELVASAIAQVLGVMETGDTPLVEGLKQYLRDKRMLLVIDNFEQVIAAAPIVADVLMACPRLKLLVTSRAVLRLRGEQEYPVPPLALPDLKHLLTVEALAQCAAVELFIQRALAAKPNFALTDENANAVAEICTRLDGLPLAIELAAARIKLLSPQAMLSRLESRLKLLTGGARDLPERHQTMRGAIAWSYDLLNEVEKRLFRRLSVFIGGCTLEAMEAVCNAAGDLEIDIFDEVESLVNKSLLQQKEQAEGEPRFTMLETIREYGLEQLEASGERAVMRQRHADFFVELAEQAAPELRGSQQTAWLNRLEGENVNLRAALEWAAEEATETAARIGNALWRFWYVRGYLSEGRWWLEEVLRRGGTLPAPVRAKTLNVAGVLARAQGDYKRSMTLLEECLLLRRRELEDKHGMGVVLTSIGNVAFDQGDYERAVTYLEEGLALLREVGDKWGVASALNNLGNVARQRGDHGRAATLYEESLALFRELGDKRNIAFDLNNLGLIARDRDDPERAMKLYKESYALLRELGDKQGIAISLDNQGDIAQQRGDYAQAMALYGEGLILFQELGHKQGVAECLEGLAGMACTQGELERALRLFGAAEALREAISALLPPTERTYYDLKVAAARAKVSHETFTASWLQGRAMTLEEAVTYALGPAAST